MPSTILCNTTDVFSDQSVVLILSYRDACRPPFFVTSQTFSVTSICSNKRLQLSLDLSSPVAASTGILSSILQTAGRLATAPRFTSLRLVTAARPTIDVRLATAARHIHHPCMLQPHGLLAAAWLAMAAVALFFCTF